MDKFEIRSEYGTRFSYSPRSYDMACRVAYALRSILPFDCSVNYVGGRLISEVFDSDPRKDAYALSVARRLV